MNGEPYGQKPPLYFWLAAAFGLPFGRVGELAARLPSAVAGVASVAGTYWIGRLLRLPTAAAWLSAGLLATSIRFAFTARRAQLDVLLCAFELAAIALFLLIETRRGGVEAARRHPALLFGLHASLGAAALVKGPVGWLPLAVFAVYLAWEGRLAAYRNLVPAWSWLLSIGPLALWIVTATALAPEGFARDAVGTNVFARFFAGSSHARPFYYYAYGAACSEVVIDTLTGENRVTRVDILHDVDFPKASRGPYVYLVTCPLKSTGSRGSVQVFNREQDGKKGTFVGSSSETTRSLNTLWVQIRRGPCPRALM